MSLRNTKEETFPSQEELLKLLNVHADKLKLFSGPFVLNINFKNGPSFTFLISSVSIKRTCPGTQWPEVSLDYETLQKVIEKPERAIRYYFQGKIKISGRLEDILKILSKTI